MVIYELRDNNTSWRGVGWKAIYKFLEEKGLKEKGNAYRGERQRRRYFEEGKKKGLIWLRNGWTFPTVRLTTLRPNHQRAVLEKNMSE
jgi:hypothetical protein